MSVVRYEADDSMHAHLEQLRNSKDLRLQLQITNLPTRYRNRRTFDALLKLRGRLAANKPNEMERLVDNLEAISKGLSYVLNSKT